MLSIFPGLLVLVSVLGFLGDGASRQVQDDGPGAAPGPVGDFMDQAVTQVSNTPAGRHRGGRRPGDRLLVGLGLRRRVHAGLQRHLRRAGGPPGLEDAADPARPSPPRRPPARLSAVIVVFTGDLAEQVGARSASAATAVTVWNIAKWPVLVVLVSLMFHPVLGLTERPPGRLPLGHPGQRGGRAVWLVASGFRVLRGQLRLLQPDVRRARRCHRVPGLAVVCNLAILFGAELDAELERRRAIAAGHPDDEEPYVSSATTAR